MPFTTLPPQHSHLPSRQSRGGLQSRWHESPILLGAENRDLINSYNREDIS